jgi:hypothetical protein
MIASHDHRGVTLMESQIPPLAVSLARAAGLDKAFADFPDDVAAAAAQALNNAHAVQVPTDPAAEPWPPMRPGIGL